ncbi:hypothetical protein FZEAL_1530 [Fusarium zealandicum]|uniref:Aminoglycoside phosphotransferase domain-containing protein n=1 Tax=Fusarium zealandicum TaxID=1053134 RepID=A0A8H4XPA6_9HYPO|nr:hypothetical protein FZEAL_1530 [Fusarium zealandicum]
MSRCTAVISQQPTTSSPPPEHINSESSESLAFWQTVLSRCDSSNLVYKNELDDDGRDVFALGSVIIKSGHLHETRTRDYSWNDKNEVVADALAQKPLAELGIKVPEIYFAGKVFTQLSYKYKRLAHSPQINDGDVLVQQRIPGVGLNIAKQYLDLDAMESFKQQAPAVLRTLHKIRPSSAQSFRSYIVPAPDPVESRRIRQQEADIIFSEANADTDLGFMHNDFTESNTIVDEGRIVGLVDWEMAGYLGWETARQVHLHIRGPNKEGYSSLEGKKEYVDVLRRLLFWRDLYDPLD